MQSAHLTTADLGTAWRDTRQFEEAYREYTQTVYALVASTSFQQQLVDAFGEYGGILQSAINNEDVQRRAAEAYAKYLEILQHALTQPSIQQGTDEAFRRYLAATRRAWVDLEAEALDPSLLVGIAQSMMSAAAVAAGNVATWMFPASSPPAGKASL